MTSIMPESYSRQLTLNMRFSDEAQWHNFEFASSPSVEPALRNFVNHPTSSVFIHGQRGTGKSHLLQAAAQEAIKHGFAVGYLSATELMNLHSSTDTTSTAPPEGLLDGYETYPLLIIDDIDILCVHPSWCPPLFHLYNKNQDLGHGLLFAGRSLPNNLDCALADLQSRLQKALLLSLHSLSDEQQQQQLAVRAHYLGLTINTETLSYICLHCPRCMTDLMDVLKQLDAASWQSRRKLTVPFIKQIMQW